MKIFAVADLHLSGEPPSKPMEKFGSHWHNHWQQIKNSWLAQISTEDTVLLAGDSSWAMKLPAALPDLQAIMDLPGNKILIRGNHDYWWQTSKKMHNLVNGQLSFLQNNFVAAGQWAICGSRGWLCPDDPAFGETDLPIFQREAIRIETSLKAAQQAGFQQIILALHYPPFYQIDKPNLLTELISRYQVGICVYGHLHGDAIASAFTGNYNSTTYHLVSCDALHFSVLPIVS